jgi:RHS repeat-associated protein
MRGRAASRGEPCIALGPAGELLYRQVGEKFIFYVGEYMTVRASGATGCASYGTCAPLPATVEADYHVLLAATRIVSVSPSRTLYYYRSRLGTVVATSLAGGVLGAQYRYDPYGKLQVALNETAATASEYGYTNALRLTGDLWHLKARVYDAATRVFLQPDSVDRYRYAYVWGDPANLSDPTGLLPVNIVWEGMETSGSLYATLGGILMDGHTNYVYSPRGPTAPTQDAQPQPTPEATVEKGNDNGTAAQAEDETKKEIPPLGDFAKQLKMKSMDGRSATPIGADEFGGKLLAAAESLFANQTYAKCWQCSDMPWRSAKMIGYSMPDTLKGLMSDPRAQRIGFEEARPGNLAIVVSNAFTAPNPEHGMLVRVNVAENLSSGNPTNKAFYSTLGSFEDPKKPGPAAGIWFTHDWNKAEQRWVPKGDNRDIIFYRWVP